MYRPEFCVRVEISQTDAETLREYHVVLGGAQRGGMSINHGYLPTTGPVLLDQIEEIQASVRAVLEGYACGLGGLQLTLDIT